MRSTFKLWLAGVSLVLVLNMGCGTGSKPDLQSYLNETRAMIDAGKYPEALTRCQWFHQHALEIQPGMAGVRLSFALSDWGRLAELYPPAKTALVQLRNDDVAELVAHQGGHQLFGDVVALDRTLHEETKTIDLFLSLAAQYPAEAQSYWIWAKESIFAYKRYDIARQYIGNVQREYDTILSRRKNLTEYEKTHGNMDRLKGFEDDNFVKECVQLIGLARATDDLAAAQAIATEAQQEVPDHRYQDALVE